MAEGYVHKFGDDINTDIILPGEYLSISDADELGRYCMGGIDTNFANNIKPGDIIVAGNNFGSGSSREHAVISIKHCSISCVIAKSFARIFYRNAFNLGLIILTAPEAVDGCSDSDRLKVDFETGVINNITTGIKYNSEAIPGFMRHMIQAGGLIPYLQNKYN